MSETNPIALAVVETVIGSAAFRELFSWIDPPPKPWAPKHRGGRVPRRLKRALLRPLRKRGLRHSFKEVCALAGTETKPEPR